MKRAVPLLRASVVASAALISACEEEQVEQESPPVLLPSVQVVGEQVTLLPSRDTSVRPSTPNRNEGTAPLLSGTRSLIAFDTNELRGAVGATDVLLSATLTLTPPPSGQPLLSMFGLYRTTAAWTELGATYNCAIDANTANQSADCQGANAWSMDLSLPNPWTLLPTAAVLMGPGQRSPVTVDVTGDVRRFLQPGASNEGWLILSGLLGINSAVFQSREGAAPPTLNLSVRRCNATLCDDGNACTDDLCNGDGTCAHQPRPDGSACDDGDGCTLGDQCSALSCAPGEVLACGDGALVVINEVESSGGTPGDWIELFNAGDQPVDVSGWVLKDNDDEHAYVLPVASLLEPGAYLVVEESELGFGLGGGDSARLYDLSGAQVDSYVWTAHASVTYGRCSNGMGGFRDLNTSTKGGENDCAPTPPCTPGNAGCAVVINEVESNLGVPGDWIELFNAGARPADLSGFVVKDNDDTHAYTIVAGSVLQPGEYLVIEEAQLGFGLGGGDSARLFTPGSTTLIDSYVWTSHAATTYARCPNGTGAFAVSAASTKGAANDCAPTGPTFTAWPGSSSVIDADLPATFVSNLSGLSYEPSNGVQPALLWAVQNDPSVLYRLVQSGTVWLPSTDDGWSAGKTLLYPNGAGSPDAEGMTRAEFESPAVYVASERDNSNNGVSRMSILRYDTALPGSSLTATHEWNLTADLPVSGPNAGLEAITWIPDAYLTSHGFRDELRNAPYDPALYPNHGSGVFVVGVESGSLLYVYVLNHVDGSFARISSAASGQPLTMDLSFDRDVGQLWSYCDNACGNRATILKVQDQAAQPDFGKLTVRAGYERPANMANFANEGIAFGSEAQCSAGSKPFFWADDEDTGGISIRQGTVQCGSLP